MIDVSQYIEQFRTLTETPVFQDWGVVGLLLNSFLSATAIPLPTEILTASLLAGGESPYIVGLVLVLGSSVGGTLNYFIGRGGTKIFRHFKKKEPKSDNQKGHKWLKKLGWAGIFFSPFILVVGDLILISAGARQYNFKNYMILMISGKILKSIIVVATLGVIF